MYFVYMVYCEGDTLYTGVAQDICRRMRQHTDRGTACARYTRTHPVQALAALWEAEDKGAALRLEYRIKQLTRTEKERLIREDAAFSQLPHPTIALCYAFQLLPQLEVSRYRRRPGITLEMCLEGKIDA